MCCCYQNELVLLESENETMALDIEKMEKYVAGLANHNTAKEANLKVLAEELPQKGFSFTFVSESLIYYIIMSYVSLCV